MLRKHVPVGALCRLSIALGAMVLSACGDVDDWEENCERQGPAFVAAQIAVENRLISPSTAKFARITAHDVSVVRNAENPPDTCMWTIRSYVDAQNSFGAMLRAYYVVKVKYDARTDSWHLEDIVM